MFEPIVLGFRYTQLIVICKQIRLCIYPKTLVCSCKLEFVDYRFGDFVNCVAGPAAKGYVICFLKYGSTSGF